MLFPSSFPNSAFNLNSVSEMTSRTSAERECNDFGSVICIFGLNSERNRVPSPSTRQGASLDRRTRPVPGFVLSDARATGTSDCHINGEFIVEHVLNALLSTSRARNPTTARCILAAATRN